jgi:hypothetical protein
MRRLLPIILFCCALAAYARNSLPQWRKGELEIHHINTCRGECTFFVFPDGTSKPHPALIVSNNELQEVEGFIYLCMISSKAYNPEYNYVLSDDMLTIPMVKQSYIKCQLLVGDIERDVIRKISRLKQPYFDEVVEKIKQTIF